MIGAPDGRSAVGSRFLTAYLLDVLQTPPGRHFRRV